MSGLSDIQQVVFIDSRVPDLQDLINGLQPGERVFVLDPSSDGVQQIADILAANNLTGLTSISIVGHGAAGQIGLGSTVLDDSNLSSHSGALAQIGASLAPGGDLQLYGCDVASGTSGQQFIADLSQFVGGADVLAATHDIGVTAAGENWTLDAATGAPADPASVPFTDQAQANFQGTLSGETGQLWVATGGQTGNQNPDGQSDVRIFRSDSDGLASDHVVVQTITSAGTFTAIGLDTSANLYFTLDNNDTFRVSNLTTGATLSTTVAASTADGDLFNAFVVDAQHNIIYSDLYGYDYLDHNPTPYASTLHGGDLLKFTYNQTTGAVSYPYTFNDAGPTWSINNNDVLLDSGTTSGATRYADGRSFWLSSDGSTLYYVDDNDNDPSGDFGFSTNAILKVSTSGSVGTGNAPTPVLLSNQSQFPNTTSSEVVHSPDGNPNDDATEQAYANGYITSLTVDPTLGIIYFTTDDVSPYGTRTGENAIWWMPITGGTATKMTLPAGVTLSYPV